MDVGRHAGKPAWDSVPCSAGPASSQNGPFSNGMSFFLEPTTVRLTCMAIRGNCEVRILLCMSLGSGIMNARALSLVLYVRMYVHSLLSFVLKDTNETHANYPLGRKRA